MRHLRTGVTVGLLVALLGGLNQSGRPAEATQAPPREARPALSAQAQLTGFAVTNNDGVPFEDTYLA